ncbi:hypothetical protein OESDEN_22398 [Oesophagostomum dentatum]|uniref:Uncharacterized protein n=1 Tax=Oesophagostomum dentatum TaxID=61180 RepID=A0A0B1S3C4_OESDE|nr:hypothetical protein OESDEN_22398 [Oesophagostomum dentatum]
MTPPGIDNPSAVCNDQPFKARSIPPIVNNVGADSGRRPGNPFTRYCCLVIIIASKSKIYADMRGKFI